MVKILKTLAISLIVVCFFASAASAAGNTGWWWNADESGWGISWQEDGDVGYLCWYLYGDGGIDVWYSAIMCRTNGDTFTGNLLNYDGWALENGFDANNVPSADEAEEIGEITISFNGNSGTVDVTGVARATVHKDITKVFTGAADPRDIDGWWYDPAQNGIGWFIEANGEQLFLGWYNFRGVARAPGTPRWYITINTFLTTDTHYAGNLLSYKNGQTLTGAYPGFPDETVEGLFEFDVPAAGPVNNLTLNYGGFTYNLERFPVALLECDPGNGGGCDPEVTNGTPTSIASYENTVDISCNVTSSCGTAINTGSIQVSVNGGNVAATVTGNGSTVQVTGTTPTQMGLNNVSVYAEDVDGNSVNGGWSFWRPDY